MPNITFLTPTTVSALSAECKALLSNLTVEIIDEDLLQKDTLDDTIFFARFDGWQAVPAPKIRLSDTDGIETVLFNTSDYTLDLSGGQVTLATGAGTSKVRADYFYAPLNDTLLERLLAIAIKEIEVLIQRPIDDNNILRDYKAVVCKRFYTNVLKNLLIESRNFFAVAISDRTINKEQIPAQLQAIREANEVEVMLEVNQLRNWNQTNRMQ